MRTVGALLFVCLAFAFTPLASAGAPVNVDDVTDGPCPGLVPTVRCAIDPVVYEVKRDVGIVNDLVWQIADPVYDAACDIVYGDPNGCPVATLALNKIIDPITT